MVFWLGDESDCVEWRPSPWIGSPDNLSTRSTGCFISWNYPSCPGNVALQLSRYRLPRWHDRAVSADITGENLNTSPAIVKDYVVYQTLDIFRTPKSAQFHLKAIALDAMYELLPEISPIIFGGRKYPEIVGWLMAIPKYGPLTLS